MLSMIRQTTSLPIICKILLFCNISLFILELTFDSLDLLFCLSPKRILFFPTQYIPSLFIFNFLHLNPRRTGPFAVYHILTNMLILIYIAPVIEKKFGSMPFVGITVYFIMFIGPLQMGMAAMLQTISMRYITLFSLYYQCSIGYSGILFGYFIIYLKIAPNEEFDFCGIECKKWIVPFVELFILSLFLQSSFMAHLTGIIMGILYICGIPGCFAQRQHLIRKIENWQILKCITRRNDFYPAAQEPVLAGFSFISFLPCLCQWDQKTSAINGHGYTRLNIGVEMSSLSSLANENGDEDDEEILFNSHE